MINCEINHPVLGWIPFTASSDDKEPHGRGIYQLIAAGAVGDVAEYVEPPITESQVRSNRNAKLQQLDDIVKNPLRWADMTDIQKKELADYRLALLDIPEQPGFPENVVWPELPVV